MADIPGVKEAVIAGIGQEGFDREQGDREDTGHKGDKYKNDRNDPLSGLPEIDLRNLPGLSADGRIALAALQTHLVDTEDHDSEEHHDNREDTGFTGILRIHGYILCRKRYKAQVMRYRIGSHGASEYQQYGGQDGRFDHGERNPRHNLPFRRIQDRGGLLKVRVHIPEDSADHDIGKWRVVQSQNHRAGKKPLTPPERHRDTGQRSQQTVGRAGYRV